MSYDHKATRCEEMVDVDCDTKLPGELATCCVCIRHDCHVYVEYLHDRVNQSVKGEANVQK
jgi:hypothetical protein